MRSARPVQLRVKRSRYRAAVAGLECATGKSVVPQCAQSRCRSREDRHERIETHRSIAAASSPRARRCSARPPCRAAAAAADAGPCAGRRSARQRARVSCPASSPDKRKAASFAWNGSEWRGWNYFGVGGYVKPGLRLEQMSAAQKEAAWDVLGAVWSPAGVAKAKNVMLLQDILAASGNGAGQRSSQRFSLVGVRHAGRDRRLGLPLRGPSPHPVGRGARQPHRLGDAVLVLGAAEPRQSGPHTGLNTLKDEEGLARRLYRPISAEAAGQGADRRLDALQHPVLRRPRARQRQEGRPRGRAS